MKKLLMLALGVSLAAPAFAAQGDQLIALETFRVTDRIQVTLPRLRNEDGSVCQTYVKRAARTPENSVVVDLADVCGPGKPRESAWLFTGADAQAWDVFPANLVALKAVTVDGLTHQEPTLARGS